MPLYDVGYREWSGQRTSNWMRWWIIATTGVRLVWRGTWLRRTMIATWAPALVLAVFFFVYEQSILHPGPRQGIAEILRNSGTMPHLVDQFRSDPASVRHEVWAALLFTFFRYPQAVVMAIIIGMIAPRLISYDLRSRAFLLYFSRPLSPWEYILGKSMIVWAYLGMVTMIPAFLMYLLGILLSPELSVLQNTWDLPFRIVGATLLLALPTTALALAYSSLTIESRYAAFAWIATWVLSIVAYAILTGGEMIAANRSGMNPNDFDSTASMVLQQDKWRLISLYQVMMVSQQWIFGLKTDTWDALPSLGMLLGIFVISNVIIYRRVSRRLTA